MTRVNWTERVSTVRGAYNDKVAECRELLDAATGRENQGFTPEERESYAALEAESLELREQIGRVERQAALATDPIGNPPAANTDTETGAATLGLSAEEIRGYRIGNVIRSLFSRAAGERFEDGLEQEASRALAERSGMDPRGTFVPWEVLAQPTGISTRGGLGGLETREIGKVAPTTLGAALVSTDLLVQSFIEILRNESMVVRAGATVIPGLVGDVDIPRQSAAGAAGWLDPEGDDVAVSELGTDAVALSPKTVGIRQGITRRMMMQASIAIEALVRSDIQAAIGLAIDLAALNGAGSGGVPEGILQTSGIGTVTTSGGTPWASIVEFETDLAAANALRGATAWFCAPAVKGTAKTTLKASGVSGYVMESDGTMNGYGSFVTAQMPTGNLLFGNWSDLLIAQWGGLDLFGDPITKADSGGLVLRGFQDVDVAPRHALSFSNASDV